MAKAAGGMLKRALDKILGVMHVAARMVYLDKAVHVAKLPFLKLHETAHAVLPWQKDIYAVTEDCKKTLAPEIADEFEKEANVFASEVSECIRQLRSARYGLPILFSKCGVCHRWKLWLCERAQEALELS